MSNPSMASTDMRTRISCLQDTVRNAKRIHIVGAHTKSGFHPRVDSETTILSSSYFDGIVSYDPLEFVITVLSGTRVSQIIDLLNEHGQYFPFDPILSTKGATIGGTVAANASGPGRYRYGGIRDFLLGIRFIDGRGNCIRGGSQVVKNAAGFDYPKLMVGSRGRLGFVYELTFKVFPKPEAHATLIAKMLKLEEALDSLCLLANSAMDIDSLEMLPRVDSGFEIAVRLGGMQSAMETRLKRIEALLKEKYTTSIEVLPSHLEPEYWISASSFSWVKSTQPLVKLPILPSLIPKLEDRLGGRGVPRRYSVGGNVAWVEHAWDNDLLQDFGPAQKFLRGNSEVAPTNESPSPSLGPFGRALKHALDPDQIFI